MAPTFGRLIPEESMKSVLAPFQVPDSLTPSLSKPDEFSGDSWASLLIPAHMEEHPTQGQSGFSVSMPPYVISITPFVAPPQS